MLIFSVPWAYVADFYGRNPVLLLDSAALFGKYVFVQFICYLQGDISLNWTWLSALHTAFGGSVTVVTALIYTIISDVVPEEKRYVSSLVIHMRCNFLSIIAGSLYSSRF